MGRNTILLTTPFSQRSPWLEIYQIHYVSRTCVVLQYVFQVSLAFLENKSAL